MADLWENMENMDIICPNCGQRLFFEAEICPYCGCAVHRGESNYIDKIQNLINIIYRFMKMLNEEDSAIHELLVSFDRLELNNMLQDMASIRASYIERLEQIRIQKDKNFQIISMLRKIIQTYSYACKNGDSVKVIAEESALTKKMEQETKDRSDSVAVHTMEPAEPAVTTPGCPETAEGWPAEPVTPWVPEPAVRWSTETATSRFPEPAMGWPTEPAKSELSESITPSTPAPVPPWQYNPAAVPQPDPAPVPPWQYNPVPAAQPGYDPAEVPVTPYDPAQVSPFTPENKPETPSVTLDKVQFSALAPKTFVKGDYSLIEIFMYEEAFRHVVEEAIAEAEAPVKEKKSGILTAERNAKITVLLTSPDLEIEDNAETQIWQGDYLNFTFAIELPEEYKKKQILFIASVYINDVIATKLKFIANCEAQANQKIEITREDVLSAFVSYASQDRNRVAMIIQGMKKARPDMDIFFDVESLRSGDLWEHALWSEIDRRDILFLCWSQSARNSKWVDAEWRYALERKGTESIEPVPIDPPDICPPPDELSGKHFNDKMLYIIHSNFLPRAEDLDEIFGNGQNPIIAQSKISVLLCASGKIHNFDKEEIIAGRDGACDLVLNQTAISRQHLQIKYRDESSYFVTDLNSTNGTFISENEQRLESMAEVVVDRGTIVKIGGLEIKLM